MEFVLLLQTTDAYASLSPEEGKQLYADHEAFQDALRQAGVPLPYSAELHEPGSARLVRHVGDQRLVTDGPFAEAKEHLGGFYVVDVPTIEDAVGWAKRIPTLPGDTIEVRPAVT